MKPAIRPYPHEPRLSRPRFPVLCLLAMALCVSGSVGAQDPGSAGDPEANRSAQAHPGLWPAMRSPVKQDPELERRVRELLSRMSVEEKVGQVVQGDIASVTPEDVRKYRLGSVLAGGNSDPGNDFHATAAQWVALADAFYQASMDTSGGDNAIPVLFGIDAVHGHNNLVGATLFPHNIGLGATRDPELLREIAAATAVEIRATGLDWTFAPTLAVPRDDRWGRTYEGYSEHPEIAALYAGPLVEGLQGKVNSKSFLAPGHVIATAKHFLGDGGTYEGRDQGDARVSEEELRDVQGAGYPPALQAGVQAVMASFSSWNGVKMHGNESLLTEVLKKRMGFDGFVVGDWNAQGQVPGCSNTDCAAAFNAGVDMMMTPDTWKGYYESTLKHVKSGEISMARLDDAVTRILRVKMRAGLFEAPRPSQRPLAGNDNLLGDPKHRAIARRAVRESLVLLKNQGGILPLDPKASVLVAGDGADDIGKQSGGWTLTWQGTGLKPSDFPKAQSIWSGIAEQVAAAGGKATLSVEGKYATKPDVAVVVFGEEPYAEFQGDIKTVAYKPTSTADLDLIKRLKQEGIPVVAVFLSGRPLWVNREINVSDAFVAAWLPGSEGGGVADVLLRDGQGKVAHDFSGKLSYSWPRSAAQTPLNAGQGGDPQFAYGYGLKYGEDGNLAPLSEDPGLDLSAVQSARFFERGALAKGWRLRVAHAGVPAYSTVVAEAKDANVTVTAVDHKAQEDAWRYAWVADGPSSVALVAPDALDLSRETNGDVLLLLTMRIETPTPRETALFVECGDDCAGRVPVGAQLAALPVNQWTSIGMPLKCFAAAGANMGKLTVAAGIESSAGYRLAISEVGYGTVADHVLGCDGP
ncbi:1,4-beta-D-glucan glucohydrolase [Pseudoxanthomonas yeongjuensis]|nr:glycoside hydrolase family 3 protein [Pseudoxanthomonas yeongjuensis]KAF1716393.1 1,4-beta-D-glucan glucohydrolase [Pseudoxanthomonas yeongjuensis]